MPGRPTNLDKSRVSPTVFVIGRGGGCLNNFWETDRYSLKKLSYRAVQPKTTNNRPTIVAGLFVIFKQKSENWKGSLVELFQNSKDGHYISKWLYVKK